MKYHKYNQITESGYYLLFAYNIKDNKFHADYNKYINVDSSGVCTFRTGGVMIDDTYIHYVFFGPIPVKFDTNNGLLDLSHDDIVEFHNCLFFGPIFMPQVDDELRQEFINISIVKDIIE